MYNSVELHWYEDNIDWDSASEVDIPVIELTEEDEVQIDNELLCNQSIRNTEQLTINSGSYSQDSEILLMTSDCINSELQDIKQLTVNSKEFITVAKTYPYTFAHPYTDSEYFLAKCFPHIYPYGRGCAYDTTTNSNNLTDHAKLMLKRGGGKQGRRYQHEPNWYFLLYKLTMQQKIGGVALKAEDATLDNLHLPETINIGEVKDIVDHLHSDAVSPQTEKYLSDAQINKYLKRMVPFSSGLKGTSLHMAKEQRGLISLVGSPLLKINGTWRWFITMAQADVYEPRLYEICLEGNSGQENHNWCWSDRQKIAKELTKEEREKILKRHPALTARMFDLKQSCIWDCIINGKHQPLGKIIDTWRRIEFQLRGTPHSHGMACVIHDGILAEFFDEADEEQISKIAKIVDNTVTACLVKRPINCNKDLEFLDKE